MTQKVCPTCQTRYERGQFCSRDGSRLLDADDGAGSGAVASPGNAVTAPGVATAATLGGTGPVAPATGRIDEEDALIGSVVAERFEVQACLGRGGMGTVYLARHRFLDRLVALKLLRPEVTDAPGAATRFEREARAASSITHENVVRIEDCGRLPDGRVYLTMEYLEGVPLSSTIAAGTLSLAAAVDVATQVARGLAAAHDKGIIHRDIKADNVFLLPGGSVKVLDFGIAKVGGGLGQTNLTQTGAIFGTPNYMSPEQALGKTVDARSDVYSLGVLLYEMLTGSVPFVAATFMGVLTQHVTEAPPPPRMRAPLRGIPAALEELVLATMAKEPGDRPQTMRALAEALTVAGASVDGVPLERVVAEAPGASESPRVRRRTTGTSPTATAGELVRKASPSRRKRWPLYALATLLLVGGAAALLHFWPALRGTSPVAATAGYAGGSATPSSSSRPTTGGTQAPLPVAKQVKIVLASVPPGARILRDGKELGMTPDALFIAPQGGVELILKKDGFLPLSVRVDPKGAHRITVTLERTPVSATVAAQKRRRRLRARRARARRARSKKARAGKGKAAKVGAKAGSAGDPAKTPVSGGSDHDHEPERDHDHGP